MTHGHRGMRRQNKLAPPENPVVVRYVWQADEGWTQDGARIACGKLGVFIPKPWLRRVADELHDIADHYDLEEPLEW